eukprot:3542947-Pyramimonas_sp.AAC.2
MPCVRIMCYACHLHACCITDSGASRRPAGQEPSLRARARGNPMEGGLRIASACVRICIACASLIH